MKKKTKLLIGTALICPLLLALILVVALVVVPHFTNKFRIDVVDDISLGASKEEVRTKLGDPYLEEKTRWGYGDKKLCSYLEDAQDISAAMEEAILRGDLERVERLNRQYENLMNEVASKKFSYIEVNFEDDAVVSVLLDKAYALEPGFKKVKEDKLTWSRVVLPYYIDYTQNSDGEMQELDCELGNGVAYSGKELSCATKFTDGSYFHAYVKSYEVKDEGYIVWSDAYIDHEVQKPIGFTSSVSPLGTISANGTWSSNINFKSITLPANVTSIGDEAFDGCSGLTSITIPDGVTSIGRAAFYGCSGLKGELKIPDSVTSIGGAAFDGCSGLTGELKIPDGVTSIGSSVFSGCSGLTSITIPDGVTSIGNYAFYECRGLTSITIPDSVTSIGNYAFSDCSGLTGELKIPDSVTAIGSSAFRECRKLTSITIPDSVTSIGQSAFYGTAYYNDNRNWENGTVLYIGDYLIDAKSSISRSYSIRSDTKVIADYAFLGCNKLTSIVIPDSVTSIGISAFYHCRGLTSVTIGNGVTSIGDSAFYWCVELTSVTIGNGVTSIGDHAFSDCDRLKMVYYKGTAEEWSRITIGIENESLTSATRYYSI